MQSHMGWLMLGQFIASSVQGVILGALVFFVYKPKGEDTKPAE